jgi:hypothetical protein
VGVNREGNKRKDEIKGQGEMVRKETEGKQSLSSKNIISVRKKNVDDDIL